MINFRINDDTSEIKRVARGLLAGKALELEEIHMCQDRIRLISESVCSVERIVEDVKWHLSAGIDNLFYDHRGKRYPTDVYFLQIVIHSIDVWDSGKSSFKRKFVLTNGELVKKTQELETAINKVMLLFLQCQKELQTLDHALKVHPEIVQFRHQVPYKESPPEELAESELDENMESQQEIVIKFVDFDMQFLIVKKKNGGTKTSVLLKNLSDDCQAEIICIPIRHQIRSITKAIYNIRMAQGHLESLKICELWEIIIPPSIKTPYFNSLENIVLAILVNSASGSVYSITPLLMNLESSIGDVSWFVRLLQLHAEGKRLLERRKGSKITWQEVLGLEVIQDSETVDNIPTEYDIWDEPTAREYINIIDKDLRLPDIQRSFKHFMTPQT